MSFSSSCRSAMPPPGDIPADATTTKLPKVPTFHSLAATLPFETRSIQRKRVLSSSSSFSDRTPPPPKLRRLVASYWSSSRFARSTSSSSAQPSTTSILHNTSMRASSSSSSSNKLMIHENDSTLPNWPVITRGPPTSGSCYYEERDTTAKLPVSKINPTSLPPQIIFSTIRHNHNRCNSSNCGSSSSSSSETNHDDDCDCDSLGDEESFVRFPVFSSQQQQQQLQHQHLFPNSTAHDDLEEEELVLLVGEMKRASTNGGENGITNSVRTVTAQTDSYHRDVDTTYNNVTPSPNMMLQHQHASSSSTESFTHNYQTGTATRTMKSPLPSPLPLWEPSRKTQNRQGLHGTFPTMLRNQHSGWTLSPCFELMNHPVTTDVKLHHSSPVFTRQQAQLNMSTPQDDHPHDPSYTRERKVQTPDAGWEQQQHHAQLPILPPPLDRSFLSQTSMAYVSFCQQMSSRSMSNDYMTASTNVPFGNHQKYRTPPIPPNSPMRLHVSEQEEEEMKQQFFQELEKKKRFFKK